MMLWLTILMWMTHILRILTLLLQIMVSIFTTYVISYKILLTIFFESILCFTLDCSIYIYSIVYMLMKLYFCICMNVLLILMLALIQRERAPLTYESRFEAFDACCTLYMSSRWFQSISVFRVLKIEFIEFC